MPRPVVPSTPDGESMPTRDLPTVPLAHRLENQHLRRRPLTAATREPTYQDCFVYALRRSTRRPPARSNDRPRTCAAPAGGRLFRPTHPPLLTTRPGGASNNGGEHIGARDPFPLKPSATRARRFRNGDAARSLARSRSRRGKSSAPAACPGRRTAGPDHPQAGLARCRSGRIASGRPRSAPDTASAGRTTQPGPWRHAHGVVSAVPHPRILTLHRRRESQ